VQQSCSLLLLYRSCVENSIKRLIIILIVSKIVVQNSKILSGLQTKDSLRGYDLIITSIRFLSVSQLINLDAVDESPVVYLFKVPTCVIHSGIEVLDGWISSVSFPPLCPL
jgi:hypothetical protein